MRPLTKSADGACSCGMLGDLYISIVVLISNTRPGGRPKKSAASVALRRMKVYRCSRQGAMPGWAVGVTLVRLTKNGTLSGSNGLARQSDVLQGERHVRLFHKAIVERGAEDLVSEMLYLDALVGIDVGHFLVLHGEQQHAFMEYVVVF